MSEELILQEPVYALADHDAIDAMVQEREHRVAQLQKVAETVENYMDTGAFELFAEAEYRSVFTDAERCGRAHLNGSIQRNRVNLKRLFMLEPAVKVLDAEMWSQLMKRMGLRELMPAKQRNEWDTSIAECNTATFTENTVRSTVEDLMLQRQDFFARKIEGVFRALSGEHVTNSPSGFNKRMIVKDAMDYGFYSSSQREYIQDLLSVVSLFMGMPAPQYDFAHKILRYVQSQGTGEWVTVMAGVMRIRVYLIGTVHIEIHPEMAVKLNQMLHHLYPHAIAPEHRTKSKKPSKTWATMLRPLPIAVINVLAELHVKHHGAESSVYLDTSTWGKQVKDEVFQVLSNVGGVFSERECRYSYNVQPILSQIVSFCALPDRVAYQFYPTPQAIAQRVVEIAGIESGMRVLEPSAGNGDMAQVAAQVLGSKRLVACIEISELRRRILQEKCFNVVGNDFLAFKEGGWDRIIMNPPFSEGRWQAHIEHAYELLKAGGRLVAVLPTSVANAIERASRPAWAHAVLHDTYRNEFDHTQIAVTVVEIKKPLVG